MNLELAVFSPKTQDNYMRHVNSFHGHFDKPLKSLGYDEVRQFLHHAITEPNFTRCFIC
ncbi:phage integrase N-terminal SAM-like domain-containing protein [Phosphitispora fastidiosa]|uniref:phage integrase N-terminal SAM-like domain-containing protein n=1 Tax=Phosphitispora fastidiosa TaxID=2837202 RepID=UPI00338DCBF6